MNDYLGLTHMQRLISGSKVDESPTWFLPVYWASSIGCLPDCDKAKDPQACVGPLSYQGCWWIDVKKNHIKSQGWTTDWNICTILSTCQCTDCSIHSSPLRLRLPRREWKVQGKPETVSTWQLSRCFISQKSWFHCRKQLFLLFNN